MPDLSVLEGLLDTMPVGVVLMDSETRVVFYNRWEEALSGRSRESVVGHLFFDEVAPCVQTRNLKELFLEGLATGDLDHELSFRFSTPEVSTPRDVQLRLTAIEVDGQSYGVLLVQDMSAIRIVERVKDFLVRTVAHDLASPMMVLSGSLELLTFADGADEREKLLQDATDAAERLRKMHADLHSVARIQGDPDSLRAAPRDLDGLLREAVVALAATARAHGVEIEYRPPGTTVIAAVDGVLLLKATRNLLERAVDVSPRGATVVVDLKQTGDRVTVGVHDQGPPLSRAARDRLFEGRAAIGDDGGEGAGDLALAVVDLVVRSHGGNVRVERPSGEGTTFVLELPAIP